MKREEYFRRLDLAICFIEENLHQKISIEEVSKKAFSSLSHFHRIFAFMTGMSLKEYIRNRRLSLASAEVLASKQTILNIALDAGYDSHESFTRAFKAFFGKTPSEFRKNPEAYKVQSRIDVYRDYAETPEMPDFLSIKDIRTQALELWGESVETTLESEQQTIDIPKFVNKQMSRDCFKNDSSAGLYGVYTKMSHKEDFTYFFGKSFTKETAVTHGLEKVILPEGLYVCFTVYGDFKFLRKAWGYIYGAWMPNSGRARRNGLDFEIYFPEKTDIYIPIIEDDTKYQEA